MSDTVFLLLLIILLLGFSLGIGVLLYNALFSPEALREYSLRRYARMEYEQARGTAHRRLLEEVLRQRKQRESELVLALERQEEKLTDLKHAKNEELRAALTEWIVNDRLTEVNGIGETLALQIRTKVFRGNLSDLHQAHQVPGISVNRQAAIDTWIHFYESKFTDLERWSYPRKETIEQNYHQKLSEQRDLIAEIGEQLAAVRTDIVEIDSVLALLSKISEADLAASLIQSSKEQFARDGALLDDIDGYFRGLFADWETVPDWFQELIAEENG